jgi:REP element-mobilizing transposase RayT
MTHGKAENLDGCISLILPEGILEYLILHIVLIPIQACVFHATADLQSVGSSLEEEEGASGLVRS